MSACSQKNWCAREHLHKASCLLSDDEIYITSTFFKYTELHKTDLIWN